jgi:Flp pilus assembly protein TadD
MTDALIQQIKAEIQKDPADPTIHFLLGLECIKAGRFDEATSALGRTVELRPDYTAAWRQLGKAHEKAGRIDQARTAYQRGIEVANQTGDLQAGKECSAVLHRLDRLSHHQTPEA